MWHGIINFQMFLSEIPNKKDHRGKRWSSGVSWVGHGSVMETALVLVTFGRVADCAEKKDKGDEWYTQSPEDKERWVHIKTITLIIRKRYCRWARGDSNSHVFRHTLLRRARLPVTPRARTIQWYLLPVNWQFVTFRQVWELKVHMPMNLRKEADTLVPRIAEFCKEPRTYLEVSREFKISKVFAREILSWLNQEGVVSFTKTDSRTITFVRRGKSRTKKR